jgi:ATP-dependent protease ClpP protease subunit
MPSIKVRALARNKAEVLIYDPIGENWFGDGLTAKRFRDDLAGLGDVSEIVVRINSPGGEVFDGFAIYTALKEHKARVVVHVDGLAASIASVIAMAGDEIVVGTGAMFMVHSPWTIAIGDSDDMRSVAEMLDKTEVGLVDAYVARTGQARATVEEWMQGETWFTRDEAIEAGLADRRADAAAAAEKDEGTSEASAAWAALKMAASAQFRAFAQSRVSVPPPRSAAAHKSANDAESKSEEDNTMPDQATASVQNADIEKARRDAAEAAVTAEAERRRAVRDRFGKFAESHRELLDACLDDVSCSADAAGAKLLAKLGEGVEPTIPIDTRNVVDGRDKFLAGAAQAILVRAGLEKREAGNEFYGRSLADLAETALSMKGVSTRGLTKDGIARKVLASHTSSDFPLLLSNAAGKVLRNAYQLAPVTWNRWCKVGSVSDFKIASRHTIGSFSSLVTKPEAGEYQQGTISEEREPIQAATKGRYISLSREMIVNDDLAAFTGMAARLGRAAARTVEADVYTLLASNSGAGPTMSDTGAFFNNTVVTTAGGHANLGSGVITVANIAIGEAAMMKQRDKGLNDYLAIQPRFLVCSVDRKQTAWEVLNSLTDVSQTNSAKRNYVQAQLNLEVVASPYLAAAPWYLFADPMDAEAFEVAFLDGVQEPFIDDEIEFMTDALNMKVRLDYGVAAIDWRAGWRSTGV